MKKLLTALLTLLVLSGCSTASDEVTKTLEDAQTDGIIIGLDDTFAPMGFRDEDNNIVGFDIDLSQAVLAKLDITDITYQPIDWDMKETELYEGNIDCIWNGFSITDERKKTILFSDPYLADSQIIVVRSDSDLVGLDDINNITLAMQKDSTASEVVYASDVLSDSSNELIEYGTNIECFMDLEAGRVDVIVCDNIMGRYVMAQRGMDQYTILDVDLGVEDYGIGFRQADTDLVDSINEALQEVKDDGTYDEIFAKWFGE